MFGKKSKNEIVVKLEELPALTDQEQFNLIEIENKNVISKVVSAVPEVAKMVANSAVAAEGLQLAKSGIYMAKLPSGAQLVKSQEMQGAVRGFFKNGSTIKGQANFLSVDGTMEKIAQMNLANVAMGAASLVVGQYYMKQINTELLAVNNGLSRIADFQDNEYKSKVLALTIQVKRIADFKAEIIENAELRKEEILRLQAMEKNAPLRAVVSNVLISVPADFYDGIIMSCFTGDTIRENEWVSEIMNLYLGVSSGFVEQRIWEMGQSGIISLLQDGERMNERIWERVL